MSIFTGNGQPKYLVSYIRQKELMRIVPFSASTLWRKVRNGEFVRPVKLSDRITAWNRQEVYEWLRSKEAK